LVEDAWDIEADQIIEAIIEEGYASKNSTRMNLLTFSKFQKGSKVIRRFSLELNVTPAKPELIKNILYLTMDEFAEVKLDFPDYVDHMNITINLPDINMTFYVPGDWTKKIMLGSNGKPTEASLEDYHRSIVDLARKLELRF
jgi:hypothetical protein